MGVAGGQPPGARQPLPAQRLSGREGSKARLHRVQKSCHTVYLIYDALRRESALAERASPLQSSGGNIEIQDLTDAMPSI